VEAELKKEGIDVETVRGGMGELSVSIDDRKVVKSNRFFSPSADGFLKKVRAALADES
jgi:hypothetical protein